MAFHKEEPFSKRNDVIKSFGMSTANVGQTAAPQIFGIVCGGRPVDTSFQQVEPTKFVYTIADASRINHISLFFLPGAQIPPDAAAAVYAKLPNAQDFQILGALSATKQSAIFKLNTSAVSANVNDVDIMMDDSDVAAGHDIVLGIALEPAQQTEQALRQARAAVARPPKLLQAAAAPAPEAPQDIASLANKIVAHAYNYMSGFVNPEGLVPIKAFDDWWNKFKSKIQANPAFLNNIE